MRDDGTLRPNGPRRKQPASRSSSMPNTLGESNDGTHSQPIAPSGPTSAPVWQSDRNAYSAIGGNGGGAAALGGAGAASVVRAAAASVAAPGVASVALMTRSTGRASRPRRRRARRRPLVPRSPSRRAGRVAGGRAAVAYPATPPRRRPGG